MGPGTMITCSRLEESIRLAICAQTTHHKPVNGLSPATRLATDGRGAGNHIIFGTGTRYPGTRISNDSNAITGDLLRCSHRYIDYAIAHGCGQPGEYLE